jgi:hypothetical protein
MRSGLGPAGVRQWQTNRARWHVAARAELQHSVTPRAESWIYLTAQGRPARDLVIYVNYRSSLGAWRQRHRYAVTILQRL